MLRTLLALIFCAWTAQALAEKPVILVLGDSLSAGYGISTSSGWVALLQRRLEQQGYPQRVVNASISGDTTSGGLARLPQALAQHQPQLVILELGANDGLRGLSLEEMRRNLVTIIDKSREQGATLLLVGVRLPPNYGALYVKKFHDVYRQLAQKHKVAFVPYLLAGVGGRADLIQADGLHPRAKAQGLILDSIWPHLLPILKRTATKDSDNGA
ncbi:MAG: arylesterase [Gammaproteobacteria bacterium]|jgi:acyl-CoA thioesterase-1|nr:arylesterase [Pseudomonadota bacterium]MCZ6732598.1 arylesterase [Gammaproteobacteria bacterium]